MTSNRIKLSLIVTALGLLLLIISYVYTLWSAERQKSADLPLEMVSAMMRDLLKFHDKRGGFPEDLATLEGIVWEKGKERLFSASNRALNYRNYYYFYTRITHHQFTLWAIPTGKAREDAASWFLVVKPKNCRRWKGAAVPLDQLDGLQADPSLSKLGTFGLIEQPVINFKDYEKASEKFAKK